MKVRCPICGKPYEIQSIVDLPTFPFCTYRCKLLDLGRWIDGAYAIPGPEAKGGDAEATEMGVEEEPED